MSTNGPRDEIEDMGVLLEAQDLVRQYFDEESATPAVVPDRIGGFQVLEPIGRGGMGVVYAAEQGELQRRVALKVLHTSVTTTPHTRKRFEREARVTAQLHHTNIVTVHAMGREGDLLYFAMELVQGHPLDDVIEHLRGIEAGDPGTRTLEGLTVQLRGPGSYAQIARIFADVADALDVAHSRGVIHRDLKPSNLILDGDGILKLTDFGLARLVGEDLAMTRTGETIGTPLYMSPEQVRGDDVDARTDVYSLGATLYEVLTLERMHQGAGFAAICADILQRQPRRAREVAPFIPRDLVTIVEKATAKERTERYATASALCQDLRAFAEGRSIAARPIGFLGRQWRKVKRHRIRAALGLAVIVLALSGAVLAVKMRSAREAGRDSEYEVLVRSGHESMARQGAYVPRALFYRPGDELQPIRDSDRVIEAFEKAVAIRPERYEAYFGRALVRGRPVEARLADVEAARERGLRPHAYHLLRAFLFADAGRHDDAEAESAKADQLPRDDDRSAFFEAKVSAMQGRTDKAIELFSIAIQSSTPADTLYYLARYERGLAEEALGNYPAAITDYAAVAGEDGRDPTLPIRIAHLWRELGHEQQAEAVLGAALDDARRQYEVDDWRLMWSACAGLQEHDWTDRVSKAAIESFPDSPRICAWRAVPVARLGDAEGAEALLARAETLSSRLPDIDASRAEMLTVQKRWPEARKLLERLVDEHPDDPVFPDLLAQAYSREKQYDKALALCRRLVNAKPYRARYHGNLAAMLCNFRRYEEATESIARGLALDAREPMLYRIASKIANVRRDSEEELRLSRIYAELAPRDATAWRALACAHNNVGEFEDGEHAIRKALQIEDHPHTWFVLGFSLEGAGRLEEALKAFRRGEAFPEDVARVARLLGRPAEFRAALEQAMARRPKDDTTFSKRATELFAAGRLEDALADLDAAIRLASSVSRHHLERARVLSVAGEHDKAELALRRAQALGAPPYLVAYNAGAFHYRRGQFAEALPELLRAVAAARTNADRADAQRLATRCEELLTQQKRLDEFLAGGEPPEDAGETLALAHLCLTRGGQPAATLRLFRLAFESEPEFAEDPRAYHRYNAACAACRAGDAQQALAWLRADLSAWGKLLESDANRVAKALRHWQRDPDLAPIRNADDLSDDFKKLWVDLEALLKRASDAAAK